MTILLGDNDYVDFSGPIRFSDDEYAQFLELLRSLFDVVEEVPLPDIRSARLSDQKTFTRDWTAAEYKVLLDWTVSQEETCRRLGRSPMAVQMRQGTFVATFMGWARAKGVNIADADLEELIEEYLKDKEQEKLRRAEERRRNNPSRLKSEIARVEGKIRSIKLRARARPGDTTVAAALMDAEAELGELQERLRAGGGESISGN